MIEMMRDPLVHIIRNAIDHGIETPPSVAGWASRRPGKSASPRASRATRS
jgi:two-component system chemotaxis sensor kinase CheA